MREEVDVNIVIRHIYNASHDPQHWFIALEYIAKLTDSNAAAIYYKDNEIDHQNCLYAYKVPADLKDRYDEQGVDPNFAIMSENVPTGVAAAVDNIIADRNELEQQYGNEFNALLKKTDIHHFAGSILFNTDDNASGICMQRTKSMGVWDKSQIDKLNILIPHIQSAIYIQKEFIRLQTRENALLSGMNMLLTGLVLFDKELQPIFINPVAKSILDYHPAISMKGGKIIASDDSQTEAINTALVMAISSKTAAHPEVSRKSLGLRNPSCSTVLPVVISHVQGILHGFEADGQFAYAAMYFSDPDRTHPLEADQLIDIYELTPAESQVAISIANGIFPEEIAKINNVAISTIRSQLKAIYRKVGVNSQAELVKVLLTGPFGRCM